MRSVVYAFRSLSASLILLLFTQSNYFMIYRPIMSNTSRNFLHFLRHVTPLSQWARAIQNHKTQSMWNNVPIFFSVFQLIFGRPSGKLNPGSAPWLQIDQRYWKCTFWCFKNRLTVDESLLLIHACSWRCQHEDWQLFEVEEVSKLFNFRALSITIESFENLSTCIYLHCLFQWQIKMGFVRGKRWIGAVKFRVNFWSLWSKMWRTCSVQEVGQTAPKLDEFTTVA